MGKTVKYICPNGHLTKIEYRGWITTIPCSLCSESAKLEDVAQDAKNLRISFRRYAKEPVAFYRHPKGGEIATDGKGHIIDPSETRYDLKKDPHGWKASGKKVREKDRKGNFNR